MYYVIYETDGSISGIFSSAFDRDENLNGRSYITATEYPDVTTQVVSNGAVVDSATLIAAKTMDDRRVERTEVFSRTLDLMNPLWYNSLTPTQQTELATWRTAWLDYPSTGIRPNDLEIFN